jgi:hypothetical protein
MKISSLEAMESDAIRLVGGLLGRGDVQDTIDINVEGDLNLSDTTGAWEMWLTRRLSSLPPKYR